MDAKFLVAPLPQFTWELKGRFIDLSPRIFIVPITPNLRRRMLNEAKLKKCSKDALKVTLEADLVISAIVPVREEKAALINAGLYTHVADLALKRFVDLLRLVEDVPECFGRSCWYMADDNPAEESTKITLMYPEWNCSPNYTTGAHPGLGLLFFLQEPWKSHSAGLLRIDELDRIFDDFLNDPTVIQEAHKLSIKKIEAFLREQAADEMGVPPDQVKFECREPQSTPGKQQTEIPSMNGAVPQEIANDESQGVDEMDLTGLYVPWLVQGLSYLYERRLTDAERERYVNPSQSRFLRAYQAFTNSFRMEDPFRYVSRVTCLEALLAVGSGELTYQLASRVAWLMKPSDSEARTMIYRDVKNYYNLRSKIVHGDEYKPADLTDYGAQVLALVRSLFEMIILDEGLYEVFFKAGKKTCDDFLQKLSIGCELAKRPGRVADSEKHP
jgi:hypothetical protein